MVKPHVPTASQLTQLATLVAATAAAATTLTAAQSALATAQTAYTNAVAAQKRYETYIYGGGNKPGILDEGSQDAV